MPRKPAVQRNAQEKYQIVMEGLKTGIVAAATRRDRRKVPGLGRD